MSNAETTSSDIILTNAAVERGLGAQYGDTLKYGLVGVGSVGWSHRMPNDNTVVIGLVQSNQLNSAASGITGGFYGRGIREIPLGSNSEHLFFVLEAWMTMSESRSERDSSGEAFLSPLISLGTGVMGQHAVGDSTIIWWAARCMTDIHPLVINFGFGHGITHSVGVAGNVALSPPHLISVGIGMLARVGARTRESWWNTR